MPLCILVLGRRCLMVDSSHQCVTQLFPASTAVKQGEVLSPQIVLDRSRRMMTSDDDLRVIWANHAVVFADGTTTL